MLERFCLVFVKSFILTNASCGFSVLPGNERDIALNYIISASFHVHSIFSFAIYTRGSKKVPGVLCHR
jgi:hypothetical protein